MRWFRAIATSLVLMCSLGACTEQRDTSTTPPTGTAPTTAAEGTISGHLYWIGGPTGALHPLAGSVRGSGAGAFAVHVGPDGSFEVTVPTGTYHLIGRSPGYKGGAWDCSAASRVVVTEGQSITADVLCQVR